MSKNNKKKQKLQRQNTSSKSNKAIQVKEQSSSKVQGIANDNEEASQLGASDVKEKADIDKIETNTILENTSENTSENTEAEAVDNRAEEFVEKEAQYTETKKDFNTEDDLNASALDRINELEQRISKVNTEKEDTKDTKTNKHKQQSNINEIERKLKQKPALVVGNKVAEGTSSGIDKYAGYIKLEIPLIIIVLLIILVFVLLVPDNTFDNNQIDEAQGEAVIIDESAIESMISKLNDGSYTLASNKANISNREECLKELGLEQNKIAAYAMIFKDTEYGKYITAIIRPADGEFKNIERLVDSYIKDVNKQINKNSWQDKISLRHENSEPYIVISIDENTDEKIESILVDIELYQNSSYSYKA